MKMILDNGQNFKSVAKTIMRVLNHPQVRQHFIWVNVEWSFNLERVPWQGEMFEWMIKSMKSCLRKVIGNARLAYDKFLTSVAEVELIVNSWLLTYLSPDDLD